MDKVTQLINDREFWLRFLEDTQKEIDKLCDVLNDLHEQEEEIYNRLQGVEIELQSMNIPPEREDRMRSSSNLLDQLIDEE
jgi:hypothetical protein